MASTDEHPRRISRADRLPEILRAFYASAHNVSLCQVAIYVPPQSKRTFIHQTTDGFLLMVSNDWLSIAVERDGKLAGTYQVAFSDLLCVEVGVILLYSWIKFVFGQTGIVEIKIP